MLLYYTIIFSILVLLALAALKDKTDEAEKFIDKLKKLNLDKEFPSLKGTVTLMQACIAKDKDTINEQFNIFKRNLDVVQSDMEGYVAHKNQLIEKFEKATEKESVCEPILQSQSHTLSRNYPPVKYGKKTQKKS